MALSKTVNISQIENGPEAVIIDKGALSKALLTKNESVLENPSIWHKIIVFNGEKHNRNRLLKLLMDYVYPSDLIPACYVKTEKCSMFLVRNCPKAIFKLCEANLEVPNPANAAIPFRVEMVLNFSTISVIVIDVQKNVTRALKMRYDSFTKILNLDRFESEKSLTEYMPLSQPKIMYFVLRIAKTLFPKKIILTNNEIKTLLPLKALAGLYLVELDLGKNLVEDFVDLVCMKELNVGELWFNGNPLCGNITEWEYVKAVKKVFPSVCILDGVRLTQKEDIPSFKKNFLCESTAYNVVHLFIGQYFTYYDTDREVLKSLYHESATFSGTYQHKGTFYSEEKVEFCKIIVNNISQAKEFSKLRVLIRGNLKIIDALKELPATKHDPTTFTVDLVHFTEHGATVVICGVYMEPSNKLLNHDVLFGFCRMFMLERKDDEFCITNEMLHVYNAFNFQVNSSFLTQYRTFFTNLPRAITTEHCDLLVKAFQKITGLNETWSIKYLEDSKFDLENTLLGFISLFEADKIPESAFISKNDIKSSNLGIVLD